MQVDVERIGVTTRGMMQSSVGGINPGQAMKAMFNMTSGYSHVTSVNPYELVFDNPAFKKSL